MNYAERLLEINNTKGFDSAKSFVKKMDEEFVSALKDRNNIKTVHLETSTPEEDAREAIKDYEGSYRETAAEVPNNHLSRDEI